MAYIDLHVHSKYSKVSGEALIKFSGSAESYVEPLEIYKIAKHRGMDFVTITDHDTIEGCLRLMDKHPKKTIMGVESTVYFPEDKVRFHLLLFGFNEIQFKFIQELRKNVYELRDYIKREKIAYSVAHPTYRLSDSNLTIEHIEKIFVLFDVYEGINGYMTNYANINFIKSLKYLTKEKIFELIDKYKIEPISSDPWNKVFTAGSDDHAALFIANCWTKLKGEEPEEIINSLFNKQSEAMGNSQNYKTYAFHLFKVLQSYFASKNPDNKGLFFELSNHIIDNKKFSFKNKIKIHGLKKVNKSKKVIQNHLKDLLNEIHNNKYSLSEKFDIVYKYLTSISNEMLICFFEGIQKIYKSGDFPAFVQSIPFLFSSFLIYIPFFISTKFMYKDSDLNKTVENILVPQNNIRKKRILWFTDTINDLNGVSITLQKIGWLTYNRNDDLKIVCSIPKEEINKDIPPNIINLEPIYKFKVPYYEKISIKIPSLLEAFEKLNDYNPDEIYISTPVSVGLIGLLYSKLFNIKSVAIYHTDFTNQAINIIGKSQITDLIEKYTKWFSMCADKLLVPTKEYINILSKRGFDISKMGIFKRGIDIESFKYIENSKKFLYERYKINEGINLLFVGRISEDKNIDFLIDIFNELSKKYRKINLIIAGDGPYLQELINKNKNNRNIYFTGKIEHNDLPKVYSGSDLFVFPSDTDTFGMVVLEAQSCSLPAIVTNIGGPKEIVIDNITGYVLESNNKSIWYSKIEEIILMIINDDENYKKLKNNSRENIINNYQWDKVLNNIFYESIN